MFEKPEMFEEDSSEKSSVSLTANNEILSKVDILKYDLYCLDWQIFLLSTYVFVCLKSELARGMF